MEQPLITREHHGGANEHWDQTESGSATIFSRDCVWGFRRNGVCATEQEPNEDQKHCRQSGGGTKYRDCNVLLRNRLHWRTGSVKRSWVIDAFSSRAPIGRARYNCTDARGAADAGVQKKLAASQGVAGATLSPEIAGSLRDRCAHFPPQRSTVSLRLAPPASGRHHGPVGR